MRVAENYDDVVDQLRNAGLVVDGLEVGRIVRCKVEGDRERRGWYLLHELTTSAGETLIVGSFGVWRGDSSGSTKIELRRREDQFSVEQRDALRRRLAEDRKRMERERRAAAERAAARAAAAWLRYAADGECAYLDGKGVQGFGLRYTPAGAAVVPLLDEAGKIHGLQFLRTARQAEEAKRPAKEFWPAGVAKKGHFHLLGSPQWIVLIAEGYATAATLHMATGYPVAVAFDAGNLAAVAAALRQRYRFVKILVCADDDALQKCRECGQRLLLADHSAECPACGKPHRAENAGVAGASAAALEVSGAWIAPQFSEASETKRREQFLATGRKRSDFNDLHEADGLHAVRVQVERRLSELSWRPASVSALNTTKRERGGELRPVDSVDELLERYVLIYAQGSMVFDREEHILLSISDMRDVCVRRDIHRAWAESPRRQIARIRNVDFDPSGKKPDITCNLWGGWPTKPKQGSCEQLLKLLWHMCGGEENANDLYWWVLRWLAFPLQRPGAKMKSTIVMHGPQGTGKNMFFEAYMSIYGEYGRMLDQGALEDKFNDWASRKLFLIADEVVARTEVYHLKNKLKTLVTGDRIRINPKNMAAYEEDNHCNLVFLSNEAMPVVLEEDDRRHAVIWTPEKLGREFYEGVLAEIREGGSAALHDYLLNVDLGDFTAGTLPPMTAAKRDLIDLGLDSPLRFVDELLNGQIPGLSARIGLSTDWYEAYKLWCSRDGARAAPRPKFVHALLRKRRVRCDRKRYIIEQTTLGPHAVLMLGFGVPEGKNEQIYLGEEIVKLRSEIQDYRGRGS